MWFWSKRRQCFTEDWVLSENLGFTYWFVATQLTGKYLMGLNIVMVKSRWFTNCSDNECPGRSLRSQIPDIALFSSRLFCSNCPPGIQSACPGVWHWCLRYHHCYGHYHPSLLCSSVCVWHSACLPSLWATASSHGTYKVRPRSPFNSSGL